MKPKTHRGAKKRVKVTRNGKILLNKPCKRHLLINKSKRQKKSFRDGKPAAYGDERKIERMLPTYF